MEVMKGGTRSLDYGSYVSFSTMVHVASRLQGEG